MKSQLADFVSLLYPRVCIACNQALTKKEEHICLSCELSLPQSEYSTNKAELLNKFSFQPKVTGAYAFLDYMKGGIVQKLMHQLKYKGRDQLGVWMGERFGKVLLSIESKYDIIIPLPLHPKKQKRRGYNQSERISQGLSNVLQAPVEANAVARLVETETQTRKSKIRRWENMRSVFSVVDPDKVEGRDILLVDDVITTGATMGVLCDEIAAAQAGSITVAAIATGK